MTVFSFMKSYWSIIKYPFFLGILIVAMGQGFSFAEAYFGSRLVGIISSVTENRTEALNHIFILLFLMSLLVFMRTGILNIQGMVDRKYIPYLQGTVTRRLFNRIHQHPPRYFEQEMSGNVADKVTNVIREFEWLYFTMFWDLFIPIITLIGGIVIITVIRIDLGLIVSIFLGLFCVCVWFGARRLVPLNRHVAELQSRVSGAVVDSITNIELVKSFGRSFYERKHLYSYLIPAVKAEKKRLMTVWWIYMRQGLGMTFIQFVCAAIPLFYWYHDKLSFPDYIFIQGVMLIIMHQTSAIVFGWAMGIERVAVMQEALDLIYKPLTLDDKPHATSMRVNAGHILIDNIAFSYTGKKAVFENFTLDILPKTKVGLIGRSGSGKSSLIKLINRYYDVTKGQILIDGQNIADVTQESLHSNIAYIMQEPALLNRTIMENIRYARSEATDEMVYEAAKKAYCHDFILSLPKGYESRVGERGVMLSGGERQRIAIARAILKEAPILILDEATSALDSESEYYIQKALSEVMKNKTVIAIAHRISTLREMDKLVYLENGQIVSVKNKL